MSDDSSPPPPVRPPNDRPPVPGWMWLLFTLGPAVVCALLCAGPGTSWHTGMGPMFSPGQLGAAAAAGSIAGLILGGPMAIGLLLAAKMTTSNGGRIVLGIILGLACAVALVGILFAGCMCLLSGFKTR